jgi:serine-type D-Ala-D-Ala carboxypeptidase/endopeptidase (penicillin-binding protein 4)
MNMKLKCKIAGYLFLFCLTAVQSTLASSSKNQKTEKLDWSERAKVEIAKDIRKFKIDESDLGIYMVAGDASSQHTLYSLNADKKMIPASITKLVTAAAVIKGHPPGLKFKTQLLSNGKIVDSVLKGDLILKGGGDPSFVSENMWFLVNMFLRSGVTSIEGDIIVDDSYFDKNRFDPSRQKERVDRAYDAPTGAMSFNWNSVNIFVRPGKKIGDKAIVIADPENEYIRVVNKVQTSKNGTEVIVDRDPESSKTGDVVLVSGSIAIGAKEQVIYKNITQPDMWAGSNLKSFLGQRGVVVKGKIRNGNTPLDAAILAESESKGIDQILADMNKFSNNYVAEMLVKGMSAKTKPPGNIEEGMNQVSKLLLELGVDGGDFKLVNPSGLTRENQITAKAMWTVIDHMHDQFPYSVEFMTSLPIAGIDGTLKNRMKGSAGERWVRAKTGFLTGVISLAGYASRKDGTMISFAMMYNGSGDEAKVRQLFDSICLATIEE